MTEQLMNLNESSQRLLEQNEELKQMIASRDILIEKLQKENAALKEQKKQDRKNLYGSKSQKISRKKKEEAPSHEENKDDFDGTSGPSFVSASDEDVLSQSDGYNVYMYIDKELVDTEHLCCLAHARAKFVLLPSHPPRGELMDKAVNYLQVFWKQLFAYLNDGRYDIDNSIAERFIRPLAGECKNSLFFVGSRMANVSAAYHTLLSTCRMNGLSALEYLKKFFHEIVKGRKDYENLLPMTIGINTNKY